MIGGHVQQARRRAGRKCVDPLELEARHLGDGHLVAAARRAVDERRAEVAADEGAPARRARAWRRRSVVVVLLPLVPVIADDRAARARAPRARSRSTTGDAAPTAARRSTGPSRGTPGLGTTRSMPSSSSGRRAAQSSIAGRLATASTGSAAARPRVAGAHAAPRADEDAGRDACPPVPARGPRRVRTSSSVGHRSFSVREREQRADDRDDPEAHDDLRLGPALELEVVMDRRHQEDALAPAA